MLHRCEKCGAEFQYRSYLERHMKRKTPCALIVANEDLPLTEQDKPHGCKFCGRRFSTVSGVSHHIRKNCKIARSKEGMEKLYEHTLRTQQERIAQLESELARTSTSTQLTPLAKKSSDVCLAEPRVPRVPAAHMQITGNQNILQSGRVYNAPVININLFGQEKHTHIDRRIIKCLMDTTLTEVGGASGSRSSALAVLLKTATLIYSDPEHPENLTCYLPNKKHEDVMVHSSDGWEIQPLQMVLPPMATRGLDVLFENQPFEDAEKYGDLMVALRDNEEAFKNNKEMRTILVRNKALLERALGSLPVMK